MVVQISRSEYGLKHVKQLRDFAGRKVLGRRILKQPDGSLERITGFDRRLINRPKESALLMSSVAITSQ